jgi:hypothetical protein
MMKHTPKLFGILALLLAALPVLTVAASGQPAQHTTAVVTTHASQGPVTVVEGATAKLTSNDAGITVTFNTSGLELLHAHTMWIVIVNRPDLCLTTPCTGTDVLTRTDIVEGNVVYGGGRVVRSHASSFAAHIPVGEVVGGWFDTEFTNPRGAEVHLIINDHGPIIPGLTLEMTRTYRAGCTDASIPTIFPPSAYADGTPGPNQCRLMQVAIFQQ